LEATAIWEMRVEECVRDILLLEKPLGWTPSRTISITATTEAEVVQAIAVGSLPAASIR
jgi:hypothetical protein